MKTRKKIIIISSLIIGLFVIFALVSTYGLSCSSMFNFGACLGNGMSGLKPCCPGLTPISISKPTGGNLRAVSNCGHICTKCGDGKCGFKENESNCPSDCKQ